jgi:thioredoxin-like negative regulator of GroEL
VFVFAMHGCAACDEYMPRFKQLAGAHRSRIPIGIYDLAKGGADAAFANKLGVQATPTTVVMDTRGRLHKFVGNVGNAVIRQLLQRAT